MDNDEYIITYTVAYYVFFYIFIIFYYIIIVVVVKEIRSCIINFVLFILCFTFFRTFLGYSYHTIMQQHSNRS